MFFAYKISDKRDARRNYDYLELCANTRMLIVYSWNNVYLSERFLNYSITKLSLTWTLTK